MISIFQKIDSFSFNFQMNSGASTKNLFAAVINGTVRFYIFRSLKKFIMLLKSVYNKKTVALMNKIVNAGWLARRLAGREAARQPAKRA